MLIYEGFFPSKQGGNFPFANANPRGRYHVAFHLIQSRAVVDFTQSPCWPQHAWRIIPFSKWLMTMVIVSPLTIGWFPFQMGVLWLINGGDPNHLQVLGWSSKWGPIGVGCGGPTVDGSFRHPGRLNSPVEGTVGALSHDLWGFFSTIQNGGLALGFLKHQH